MSHAQPHPEAHWLRRALRVVAASMVLVAAVAAPAQLVPSALAAGGDHGAFARAGLRLRLGEEVRGRRGRLGR